MRPGNLERNTYVRKQITKATLELLQDNELDKIPIGQIADRAQVSRVSFYRNYDSKEDVLKTHVARLMLDWDKSLGGGNKPDGGLDDDQLASLFGHLKNHADLYQLLERRGLLYLLRDALKELYGPKPEHPNFGAYLAAFVFYGMYGWIEEWVARGMQESGEEMAALLKMRNMGAQ